MKDNRGRLAKAARFNARKNFMAVVDEEMKEQGISPQELSKTTGISMKHLFRFVNGHLQLSFSDAAAIAVALDTSLDRMAGI